jgi:peroxiredoxin Q/BCP
MRLLGRSTAILCTLSLLGWGAASDLNAKDKKGKAVSTLKVGEKAPTFTSTDDQGKPWKSSDVVGKKVLVMFFFPAALTGGWTKQACGFRDEIDNLKSKNVEVVGISGDSVEGQKFFKKEKNLNYTLLADEKGEVAKKFGIPVNKGGVFKYKTDNGKVVELVQGVRIARYTVVIDKAGNIAAIDPISDAGGDAKRIADLVKKLEAK